MKNFKTVRFLGLLDRGQMDCEFSSADMFVLPTLTEGMASVLVAAVTNGSPVVTTRGAGFDIAKEYTKESWAKRLKIYCWGRIKGST